MKKSILGILMGIVLGIALMIGVIYVFNMRPDNEDILAQEPEITEESETLDAEDATEEQLIN